MAMRFWLPKTAAVAPSDPDGQLGAYRAGRRDERVERAPNETVPPDRRVAKAELDEAYERGRRDGRARRRGSPALGLILFILAIVGVSAIVMAVRYGSFTAAGQAVDATVSSASQRASAPVRNAADRAGDALQNAGQNLKQRAGSPPQ
jgi:hypothetical protein